MGTDWGTFSGEPILKWLKEGRQMQLTAPITYVDRAGVDWPVPENTQTDGASIPRALWVIAAPFEGQHRTAALIHDYYCDVRRRPWRAVHRMFYEAMRACDVNESVAKVMYFGVMVGGPKWNRQTIVNANLEPPRSKFIVGQAGVYIGGGFQIVGGEEKKQEAITSLLTDELKGKIASFSLKQIDARAKVERVKLEQKVRSMLASEMDDIGSREGVAARSNFQATGKLSSDHTSVRDDQFRM